MSGHHESFPCSCTGAGVQLVMKLKWRVQRYFPLLFDYSSCVHCAAAAAPFAVIFTLAL